MKAAIRDDNPVFFFENRHLYTVKQEVPDGDYVIPIGKADVKREGRDLTIIATGYMVNHSLDAAKVLAKEQIDVEVVDPRTLVPLDLATLVRSARKTGRVLIVHDAWRNCGIGAEIAASLYETLYGELKQPIERLAHLDVPHPYSPVLEDAVRPNREKIAQVVRKMMSAGTKDRSTQRAVASA
jgi:pyruvate dehydrogenase E1 component beta subunit